MKFTFTISGLLVSDTMVERLMLEMHGPDFPVLQSIKENCSVLCKSVKKFKSTI